MALWEGLLLLLALMAVLSIVWSTLRTGIPPMMSNRQARRQMLALILPQQAGDIIDLGSGWGTLLITAARQHPYRQVIGYELSWLPWLVSRLRTRHLPNVHVYRCNFIEADFSKADTLLCYLMPKGMQALAKKLDQDDVHGLTIISNTFVLPNACAQQTKQLTDLYRSPVYVYER